MPSNVVNANYRVLIRCTHHFQSGSLFFVYFGLLVFKSPQCLISAQTHGGEGGHLFRLSHSVVLRGGRTTAIRYPWRVWGVRVVYGPLWVCPSSQRVCFPGLHCSGSRLLCRNCLKRALGCVHFPGLGCSGSGSRVVHRGTDSAGPGFCALPRSEQLLATGCLVSALSPGGRCVLSPPWPGLGFWVRSGRAASGLPCVSSGELISG